MKTIFDINYYGKSVFKIYFETDTIYLDNNTVIRNFKTDTTICPEGYARYIVYLNEDIERIVMSDILINDFIQDSETLQNLGAILKELQDPDLRGREIINKIATRWNLKITEESESL